MFSEIILIGPMHTGKSTQGKLLAEKLGVTQYSLDQLRWQYYEEIGFSQQTQQEIGAKEGMEGVYRYWKPFEAHAVERLLQEHRDCVIDFGAGHSVYEDEALFARVQQVLMPYRNVILLLPSPDPEESIRLLRERIGTPGPDEWDLNAHFVRHPSNYALAKRIIYTAGKTPEQTRDEILAILDPDDH